MRVVLQRVARARVRVGDREVAGIGRGLLLLVGVGRDDGFGDYDRLAEKVVHLRVFEDAEGRMNRSLRDVGGQVLVVPNFTLYGSVRRGRRPSWDGAAPPEVAADRGHYDHVGSAAAFCGQDLPLHIHEADAPALTDPLAWGAGYETPPIPVARVRTVVDGDVLTFAGFRIEVLHTPGHTPGSVCYRTDGWVLSGDLVFAGTIGRSDFPNSSGEDMARSLERFLELPDELDVLPGHGPRTTVGRERQRNPYLVRR
ncbi:MAG: D-aminoacyl-tRNA deacylase [Candidatus Velamenicoccus archaeovorus]